MSKLTLHVLFGQMHNRYEGEYGPEALAVADDLTMEENPEWMQDKIETNRPLYASVAVVKIAVSLDGIKEALKPATTVLEGEII